MAQKLTINGGTSDPFRIEGRDLPAKLQIIGGGTDTAEIHVSADGNSDASIAATSAPYKVASAVRKIDEAVENATALDTVGVYQVKNVSGGDVYVARTGDL